MKSEKQPAGGANEEQLAYARVMNIGMKLGILMVIISFAVYVFGVFDPYVTMEQITTNWDKKPEKYLEVTGTTENTGWSWTGLLGYGDYLNFFSIAFLASLTAVCYLRILPILIRKKDYIYVALAVTEVLVLALAASGILKGGGH